MRWLLLFALLSGCACAPPAGGMRPPSADQAPADAEVAETVPDRSWRL